MINRLILWMSDLFSGWADRQYEENYIPIAAVGNCHVEEDIPDDLRTPDVPRLGPNQDKYLRMAMKVSKDRVVRIKWLRAVQHLRAESKTGWVLEGGANKLGHSQTPESQELNKLTMA